MNINVTIAQVKRQLNIEQDYTNDDMILQQVLDVSKSAVQTYLGTNSLTGYTETTIPIEIIQAIIMLSGHFYLNRNMVAFAQGVEIPYSFKWLLDPYRNIIIG
jgi:hypothetical protein